MTIRKVLLPVGIRGDIAPLAQMAFALGKRFPARVEGVFAQSAYLDMPVLGDTLDPGTIDRMIAQARDEHAENTKRARATFESFAQANRTVESAFVTDEGNIDAILARRARLADLTIIGTTDRYDSPYWRSARETALFRSGRPAMLVPASSRSPSSFDKVLIAWKEGIEVARAVAAAHPFLGEATEVHLVTIGEDETATGPLHDVEDYLQLHYAEVRSEVVPYGARDVEATLLEKAESLGALLVMGAYSHAFWRERVFGGVTDFMLRQASVPIVMMH